MDEADPPLMMNRAKAQSPDRILYADETVCIGIFDCPRDHPMFPDSGPASGDLVVFPRDAVRIEQARREPVVADSRLVTLYNERQEYRRHPVSHYGDRSLWLRFPRAAVVEAMLDAGKAHRDLESRPFKAAASCCTAQTYLRARNLMRYLIEAGCADPLAVHESTLALLRSAVAALPEARRSGPAHRPVTELRHRRLVANCRALLGCRFREPLTLRIIASELHTTPFHLSRVFSEHTGSTIHEHLMNLRLRAAVDEMIAEQGRRLTDISLDLGFATPSHFSKRFKDLFDASPGAFRRGPAIVDACN
jgi:AraC-like DNA-binding protein